MNNTTSTTITYESPYGLTGGLCFLNGPVAIYSYGIVLILLAIISTFENLLVIIAICKYDVLRTTSIILLGILAVIDFVTGCVVTPIKVWLTLRHYEHARSIMVTFGRMFISVVYFSLSTVLMISVDRFCHVYFLERYNLTKTKLTFGLLLCWVIPFTLLFCMLLGNCGIGILWLGAVYFLFCIIAMIISYIGMVVSLRKHASNAYGETHPQHIENQRRAVKTTLIIIGACIVMNVPPVLSVALGLSGKFSRTLCAIAFFALLANSAVNPLIYCLRIPVMKKCILKLLRMERFTENNDESEDIFLSVVAETNIEMGSH